MANIDDAASIDVAASIDAAGFETTCKTVLKRSGDGFLASGFGIFDLAQTLDCGQAFRWRRVPGETEAMTGIAGSKPVYIACRPDGLFLDCADEAEAEGWLGYLGLREDYGCYRAAFPDDPVLRRALDYCGGIRILRQDFWEALASFVLSSNNNISRIKGIIENLCRAFGEPLSYRGGTVYSFPKPEAIAELSSGELACLRAGYRADYLTDAAKIMASGEIDAEALAGEELCAARKKLMAVRGVGPKVADCVLLFGLHRLDAFPVDVWVRRALDRLYGGTPPDFGPYAGLAQQYLFHYIRTARPEERGT